MEPEILQLGKAFHRRVQSDWERTAEGKIHSEHGIVFGIDIARAMRVRRGRVDLFVDELGDFVTIVEIKSTDWEKVKPASRRNLLSAHSRQVWKYVENYVDADDMSVCPGIIYPSAPNSLDLKRQIETFFNNHCIQIVWYDDP
ncbi:MAG: hypothetical protein HYY46_12945 [Deltaproteobacteria bacterium]|nr:hypothetical protein [Deltaproteobacteria bacterium]